MDNFIPIQGLTNARVKDMQDLFGMNRMTPPSPTPSWVRFCKNLFGGFSLILWIGAALCMITFSIEYDLIDTKPYQNVSKSIVSLLTVILCLHNYVAV